MRTMATIMAASTKPLDDGGAAQQVELAAWSCRCRDAARATRCGPTCGGWRGHQVRRSGPGVAGRGIRVMGRAGGSRSGRGGRWIHDGRPGRRPTAVHPRARSVEGDGGVGHHVEAERLGEPRRGHARPAGRARPGPGRRASTTAGGQRVGVVGRHQTGPAGARRPRAPGPTSDWPPPARRGPWPRPGCCRTPPSATARRTRRPRPSGRRRRRAGPARRCRTLGPGGGGRRSRRGGLAAATGRRCAAAPAGWAGAHGRPGRDQHVEALLVLVAGGGHDQRLIAAEPERGAGPVAPSGRVGRAQAARRPGRVGSRRCGRAGMPSRGPMTSATCGDSAWKRRTPSAGQPVGPAHRLELPRRSAGLARCSGP